MTLQNKLLAEALSFRAGTTIVHVEGSEGRYKGDFSLRAVQLLTGLGMEPVWLNRRPRQETVVFSRDGIVVELN